MDDLYSVRQYDKHTLVVFRTPSMMNPSDNERMRSGLLQLVEGEKRARLVLDFGRVQFISSTVIGILLTLNKRLAAPGGASGGAPGLVLCGVNEKLLDLLKISKLDRLLTIKPTRKEALAT
jgi:anti-sigma B factor antagonist